MHVLEVIACTVDDAVAAERGGAHRLEIVRDLTQRILHHAPGVRATFHRAFEELPDPGAAIAYIETIPQVDHILTSGVATHLDRLAHIAAPELQILAGGGVTPEVIQTLVKTTAIREFHVGRAAPHGHETHQPVDPERVRAVVDLLAG